MSDQPISEKSITTAAELVEYLFTNGDEEGDGLKLMRREMGGDVAYLSIKSRAAVLAAVEQLVESVRADMVARANNVQNGNDLNDGGFFEAGFYAARAKIVDELLKES